MNTTLIRSRIQRALVWTMGVGGAFVVLMGLGHTTVGRPYLAKLGFMAPRCPLGLDAVNPKESEPRRVQALQQVRGESVAPAQPAWGFVLGSTRASVQNWVSHNNVSCTEGEKGMVIACSGVASVTLPEAGVGSGTVDHLTFRFDLAGHLAGVAVQRKFASQAEAEAAYAAMEHSFRSPLGAASSTTGDTSLSGPLASREATYRYKNYLGDVSAANLGDRGLVVRAQAQHIPD